MNMQTGSRETIIRAVATVKRPAGLYLLIAGGGYALAGLVALLVNGRSLLTTVDHGGVRDLRSDLGGNGVTFAAGGATLIAGAGMHKLRRWAPALAAILGALAITEAVAASAIDPRQYHNFTVAWAMAAILLWALLPRTGHLFSQRSSTIS